MYTPIFFFTPFKPTKPYQNQTPGKPLVQPPLKPMRNCNVMRDAGSLQFRSCQKWRITAKAIGMVPVGTAIYCDILGCSDNLIIVNIQNR